MTSIWNGTAAAREFPPLAGEHRVDVAVVGGGIAGLSAAWRLKQAGKTVAVVEARRLGAQVTGGSTGKVTSQHGLIYAHLIEHAGRDKAKAYADANQWAVEEIAGFVEAQRVACDFERRTAFVAAHTPGCAAEIEREGEAAASLGLPVRAGALPDGGPSYRAALAFDSQAQFHPRKYLDGLAAAIDGDGCLLFEESLVTEVETKRPIRVRTREGAVAADDLVIATGMPFLDRGGFFARAFPRAHAAVAAPLPADRAPGDMVLCVDGSLRSYRSWQGADGAWLIAIGEGFVPGHPEDVEGLARSLEDEARRHWPIGEATHRWVTEDYHAADRRPLVGRLMPLSRHVFAASGFGGWGLTNGTVAGRLLADAVLRRDNPWAEVYDPLRLRSAATARFLRRNAHVAQHWVSGMLERGARRRRSELANGEGAILGTEDGKTAVFRDSAGAFHSFSPYCPHMGCLLSWNNLDRTWDCSCHGSRFEAEGRLLHGPARQDLKPKPLG